MFTFPVMFLLCTESTPIPLMFSMCYHCVHITCMYYIPCLFIIFISFYMCISQVWSVQLLLFTYRCKFYILLSQWYCNVLLAGLFWFSIVLTIMSQFFLLLCFSCLFFPFLVHTDTHTHTHTLHWLLSLQQLHYSFLNATYISCCCQAQLP